MNEQYEQHEQQEQQEQQEHIQDIVTDLLSNTVHMAALIDAKMLLDSSPEVYELLIYSAELINSACDNILEATETLQQIFSLVPNKNRAVLRLVYDSKQKKYNP